MLMWLILTTWVLMVWLRWSVPYVVISKTAFQSILIKKYLLKTPTE